MCIKFSMESIPCNSNSYHLLNTYFYRAVGFTCISLQPLFIKYSLMHQVLF